MSEPFDFWGCVELREGLNTRADDVRDFAEHLEVVPADSIYYHSVRVLLRHRVELPWFADDFSSWLVREARDPALAERVALLSPFDCADIESYRSLLLDALDSEIRQYGTSRATGVREPFYFMRSHLTEIRLGRTARTLGEFRDILATIDESAIYYHAVERRSALHGHGDFSAWLDEALGLPALARSLAALDPFAASLVHTRDLMLVTIDTYLAEHA